MYARHFFNPRCLSVAIDDSSDSDNSDDDEEEEGDVMVLEILSVVQRRRFRITAGTAAVVLKR